MEAKKYGFCNTSLAPGRLEPNDRSEQVTQLLFGQCYTVLAEVEKWVQIQLHDDAYVAWIDRKLHTELTEAEFEAQLGEKHFVSVPLCSIQHINSNTPIRLSFGAQLPKAKGLTFSIGKHQYRMEANYCKAPALPIEEFALSVVNSPYIWGGKSIFGFDCSGFVQVFYSLYGYKLPRDAYQQEAFGTLISLKEAKSGALAFFINEKQKIFHVGIYLGNGQIIHASGKVRIDTLDEKGIYNETTKSYTHLLHSLKTR